MYIKFIFNICYRYFLFIYISIQNYLSLHGLKIGAQLKAFFKITLSSGGNLSITKCYVLSLLFLWWTQPGRETNMTNTGKTEL